MNAMTPIKVTILLAAVAALAGCGPYTMKSPYRSGIRSVAVPIWARGKSVYRRNIEMDLTEAIQKRIETWTPYKLASETKADTKLTGRIVRIDQQALAKVRETGRPVEVEVTFVLEFSWRDLRSGKELLDKTNYRVSATYVTSEPFRQEFFHGSQEVINLAAQRIVEEMADID